MKTLHPNQHCIRGEGKGEGGMVKSTMHWGGGGGGVEMRISLSSLVEVQIKPDS